MSKGHSHCRASPLEAAGLQRMACLPAPGPMAPPGPWAGPAASPGLALGRDTSSPWPHSRDSYHLTHGHYGTPGCPKPCRDGSVPTSPNLNADECQDPCPGALCSTRTVVPGPQRGIRVPRTTLRRLQHKRCYPLKLTHCVSSPVEKALATHCRSSGLKGTRTRWTPGLRSTALSGYMK